MTPLGVVFLFMLVNWWVEKQQRFYSTFTNVFLNFCHVFLRFLTFYIFFLERFFTSMLAGGQGHRRVCVGLLVTVHAAAI